MEESAMAPVTLRDFIDHPQFAACRIAVVNRGAGAIFIIRTRFATHPAFSVVDCSTPTGLHYYADGPQIMAGFGELRRVELI